MCALCKSTYERINHRGPEAEAAKWETAAVNAIKHQ